MSTFHYTMWPTDTADLQRLLFLFADIAETFGTAPVFGAPIDPNSPWHAKAWTLQVGVRRIELLFFTDTRSACTYNFASHWQIGPTGQALHLGTAADAQIWTDVPLWLRRMAARRAAP